LYRINNQSEVLERALDARGISYQLRGGERFFARTEIKSAVQLIRAESLSPSGKPLHQAVSDIVRSLGWQANKPTEVGVVASKWEALNALLSMLDDLPEGAGIKDFALELADHRSGDLVDYSCSQGFGVANGVHRWSKRGIPANYLCQD
jgi:DNA helicase-2/ATP-dependent DNA helicase PcrA